MRRATPAQSGFMIVRRLFEIVPAICLLVVGVPAGAEPLEELDTPVVALDSFDFEGLKLPANIDQFKRQYPKAKSDSIGLDDKVGLTCFTIKDLPQADLAKFYFYDGAFYQLAITYNASRADAMGGMPAVVRRMVSSFGPALHASMSRWTWILNSSRRADLYPTNGGTLVVTDTNLAPVVNKRMVVSELTSDVDLGIEAK